jgi:hypothetical protein
LSRALSALLRDENRYGVNSGEKVGTKSAQGARAFRAVQAGATGAPRLATRHFVCGIGFCYRGIAGFQTGFVGPFCTY